MSSTAQQWLQRFRRWLIAYLRPGRDEDELLAVLSRAEAVQSDDQRSMLEHVIAFTEVRVREVMVSRSEVHAVSVESSLEDVERLLIEKGVNRLPVMDGDIDHILGVIHAQDLLAARVRGERPALGQLMRPCLRVRELEQVPGLLEEMKEHSCHIAMVLDEYGGTAGLVTLTDLLDEIVGEIGEEGEDDESEACHLLTDGSYMVQGRMHIEDLEEKLGMQLPQGDYDTVAGWLISKLGRIPKRDEKFTTGDFQVHVIEADPRRIVRVRLQHKSHG